jgi:diguanylate cyclase (GGDEF)-like protein
VVESAQIQQPRDRRLSRALNTILITLIGWGSFTEVQNWYLHKHFDENDWSVLAMLGIWGTAYALNRRGKFTFATILTIGFLAAAIFLLAVVRHATGSDGLSVLYYLIIVILMSELFFSMKGYIITVSMILTGVLLLAFLNAGIREIFTFLFVFCTLIGFSSYNRRLIEEEQVELAGKFDRERSLLHTEKRRSAQLGLLEEVGRRISSSLDEGEILQRTLEAVIGKFGYAEAAISMLIDEDILEVTAITGTEDFGYRPGFRQKMDKGIIGHVAQTREPYISEDVSKDPYYFSSAKHYGSAAGIPILDKDKLLGIIYVESIMANDFMPDDVQTLQTLANQVATSIQKARLYTRAQEHLQIMTILQSVSHAVMSSLELNEILHNVIELLQDSLGYSNISIYLLEDDVLRLSAQLGYPEHMIIYQIPVIAGVGGRAIRTRETQFIPDVSIDSSFLRASQDIKSEICVPLLKKDNVLGILNVESNGDVPLTENDVNLLNALAGPLAIAIDNARLHAEVKTMALTDAVSALANRRAFDEILNTELTRASRYGHLLSLIILDLDSFKQYNDNHGHPAGDVRLREIGEMLKENVREPDIAARYGGEEFAVILPNTSKAGAVKLAERLRESAEAKAGKENHNGSAIPGYTISLGVATFPEDATTVKDLLLAADNAELTAKRLGKNRVYATT